MKKGTELLCFLLAVVSMVFASGTARAQGFNPKSHGFAPAGYEVTSSPLNVITEKIELRVKPGSGQGAARALKNANLSACFLSAIRDKNNVPVNGRFRKQGHVYVLLPGDEANCRLKDQYVAADMKVERSLRSKTLVAATAARTEKVTIQSPVNTPVVPEPLVANTQQVRSLEVSPEVRFLLSEAIAAEGTVRSLAPRISSEEFYDLLIDRKETVSKLTFGEIMSAKIPENFWVNLLLFSGFGATLCGLFMFVHIARNQDRHALPSIVPPNIISGWRQNRTMPATVDPLSDYARGPAGEVVNFDFESSEEDEYGSRPDPYATSLEQVSTISVSPVETQVLTPQPEGSTTLVDEPAPALETQEIKLDVPIETEEEKRQRQKTEVLGYFKCKVSSQEPERPEEGQTVQLHDPPGSPGEGRVSPNESEQRNPLLYVTGNSSLTG